MAERCVVAILAPPTVHKRLLIAVVLLALGVSPARAAEPLFDGLDSVAMEGLRAALRRDPLLAQTWFRLRAGDPEGARKEATALVSAQPRDPDRLHMLGIAAAADGKRMMATGALRRSLRLRPDGWVALHLVDSLLEAGRVGAADQSLRRVEPKLPGSRELARARAFVHVARGDFRAARALLEQLESDSPSAGLSWQLSILLAEMGETAAALAAIRRAVDAEPTHPGYRRLLFTRLVESSDWSGLVAATAEAGAGEVGGGLPGYYRGLGLLRQGKVDDAGVAFASVVAHGRPDPFAAAGAAGHLLQIGRYADAEKAARAALISRSADGALHHLLAMTLSRLGRESEALAHYRRASEILVTDATWRFDLVMSLCGLERGDEAADALSRARRDFPDDPRFVALGESCVPST